MYYRRDPSFIATKQEKTKVSSDKHSKTFHCYTTKFKRKQQNQPVPPYRTQDMHKS